MDAGIRNPTLGAVLLRRQTLAYQAAFVLAGVALLSISAQVRFPLPFTPVPVTGQTFAVLFLGGSLGSRMGIASAGGYWIAGACGMPVFNGGSGGWAVASGATGGYMLGFAAAAFAVGWFAERGWNRGRGIVVPLLVGEALIYVFGLPWLALFVGPRHVLQSGLLPFIPGDLVKIAAVTAALPGGWSAMKRFGIR
ncbi:MAG: biotin transporter BioY [Acidobacteria bacterium]|nr:biotin transporter BioY [Acidobacteriota bacterium]